MLRIGGAGIDPRDICGGDSFSRVVVWIKVAMLVTFRHGKQFGEIIGSAKKQSVVKWRSWKYFCFAFSFVLFENQRKRYSVYFLKKKEKKKTSDQRKIKLRTEEDKTTMTVAQYDLVQYLKREGKIVFLVESKEEKEVPLKCQDNA